MRYKLLWDRMNRQKVSREAKMTRRLKIHGEKIAI
jgi:hypothetical protein